MATDLQIARGQATMDVSSAILKAAGEVFGSYGTDEKDAMIAVLAGGFIQAIDLIDKNIDGRFKKCLCLLLTEKQP